MKVNLEYCDPFDGTEENIWMKIEHCGRYLYACDRLVSIRSEMVLDVACADGYGTKLLASGCSHVCGMDINEKYLEQAKSRVESGKVAFVQVDFDHCPLPVDDRSQDAVICFETIEHVGNPEHLLREIYRVLKPGGFLMLSFPNAAFEKLDENGNNKDPYHKHIFQKGEIMSMLELQGFVFNGNLLGQSLCNIAYANLSKCQKEGLIVEEEADKLFLYDETSVRTYARFLGYPNDYQVDDSYSYIIEMVKQ